MATCPKCHGYLGPRHRCVGLWRLRLRRAVSATIAILIALVLAEGALYLIVANPSELLVGLVAVITMFLAQAIWSALQQ